MGSNRKQPFGYTMEFGKIVIHTQEAQWVQEIYRRYNLGASFVELAQMMQEANVPYDADKPWNKNMVARILADERYIGGCGFQPIVSEDVFRSVVSKRTGKTSTSQKTEAKIMLRRKCDFRVTPYIEQEVLYLLNRLVAAPEQIKTPDTPAVQSNRLKMLKTELEDLLARLPVDEERTREKLKEIAVAMYETVDPREYETDRMRRVFQKESARAELDARLIAIAISAVLVDGNGKVKIKLKNEQVIERGESQ